MEITDNTSYTYADYAKLPEGAPYQLIEGKLVMSPSPTIFHQHVILNIARAMTDHVNPKKLGIVLVSPIDVYLSDTNTFQPDIVFVAADRLDIIEEKNIRDAPNLVVEVLSPSTARYDLNAKMNVYAKHGVVEYWVVDPTNKSVDAYELNAGGYKLIQHVQAEETVSSRTIKGFTISCTTIFERGLLNK